MRLPVLLAVFLFVGCASSGGFDDQGVIRCDETHDLTIEAGIEEMRELFDRQWSIDLLVRVSNNKHEEITVQSIVVVPIRADPDREGLTVDPMTKSFKETIAEDREHTFELPMTATSRRTIGRITSAVSLSVSVKLEDGETFLCPFSVPIPAVVD
jgi:hypothetical protein